MQVELSNFLNRNLYRRVNNTFIPIDTKEDSVEEQEIETFFTEFTALLRLLQSELRLMLGIVPLPHQKAVLSIILRDALEMISHDAEVEYLFFKFHE